MKEEKSLVKVEQKGILSRIKKFLSSIFKNKKEIQNEQFTPQYTPEYEERPDFKEDIQIKRDLEKERIEKLQQDFEKGLISEKEISAEDTTLLHKLYDEQIEELQEKIKLVKASIEASRNKINI